MNCGMHFTFVLKKSLVENQENFADKNLCNFESFWSLIVAGIIH